MSKYIVFEGWLTKSPPTRRLFKTKWRRRWFALRQSGELPGQYFLDYYSDRSRRRLKGSINLDLCEQVDAGLHMTRNSNGSLDPRMRGSVFSIQTQSRTYHLEADCEADMEKWVDAICRVCGLRATSTPPEPSTRGTYQNSRMTVTNDQYEFAEGTGPYIPISECITGVRAPDSQRTFTFDPNNIIIGAKSSFDAVSDKSQQIYLSHPQIRVNNVDFSENESNLSDEECKSLNASQSNIESWTLARSYVRPSPRDIGPAIRASRSGNRSDRSDRSHRKPPVTCVTHRSERKPLGIPRKLDVPEEGPPVPPRPPKTIGLSKEHRESFQGPKLQEPEGNRSAPLPWQRSSRSMSQTATQSVVYRPRDDDDDFCLTHSLQQYCNLTSLPPVVDRALKPRIASTSVGHVNQVGSLVFQPAIHQPSTSRTVTRRTSDVLQYLDLDLTPKSPTKNQDGTRRVHHAKSFSAESRADYKTVDFVKTEAFNITRQDAEASRSVQQ